MPHLSHVFLSLLVVTAIFALTTPSCVNDPIGVDPIDTIDMDTMIPADTSLVCDPDTIYFRHDVLPIIRSSCGMELCHDAITRTSGFEITSYETLISSGLVEPFDPEASMMYELLTTNDLTEVMPPSPRGPISDTNILVVRRWIEQGALNLDCPDVEDCEVPATVSFESDVFPIIDKYCIGCHSGNNPWAGLFLRDHDEIADATLNGILVETIEHLDGFPVMPKNIDKLAQCDIDKIKSWAQAGAPNN